MNPEKLDQTLVKSAIDFLLSDERITKEILDKYLQPDKNRSKPNSINKIYKSILSSAQNVQRSPFVIGKSISGQKGNIDNLDEILFDFDPYQTLKTYINHNPLELYKEIKKRYKLAEREGRNKLWIRYCKTIISSARFLSKFESHKDFYKFIDLYDKFDHTRPLLPILLSFEIDGFGYALSCDFLKELGYVNFGKPDTHIKDIFMELGLLVDLPKSGLKTDYKSMELIQRIASNNKMTPYAVDKLLWLIGSGEFYFHEIHLKNNKKIFIKTIKNKYGL